MAKNAFNTVTPLSKALAFIMFVTFPFAGFYLGMQYQKAVDKVFMPMKPSSNRPLIKPTEGVMCTMDAKQCPDGSYVGRSGPKCEFEKCPGD